MLYCIQLWDCGIVYISHMERERYSHPCDMNGEKYIYLFILRKEKEKEKRRNEKGGRVGGIILT